MDRSIQQQAYAIVIGISHYSGEVATLPAAAKDALRFARSICHWGIPESNIFLLLNSDASIQELSNIFDQLEKRTDKFKLIFYFCGHGIRDSGEIPTSHLLLHDGSINLDHLMKKICSLSSSDNYVMIDACHLRINQIINPKLMEELEGRKISHKSLFCLLSSGIEQSFENRDYGYFTEALLKSLSQLRESNCSSIVLLEQIQNRLRAEELPTPDIYTIGDQKISFNHTIFKQDEILYRFDCIAKIQDNLIQNRSKIVCLTGPLGSGKTFLSRSMLSEKLKVFYTQNGLQDIYYDPNSLIIIDHVERLNPKQLNELIEKIAKLKNQFLLISDHLITTLLEKKFQHLLVEMELLPLSYEEALEYVKIAHPMILEKEFEVIFLLSKGNPSKIEKAISLSSSYVRTELIPFNETVKKAISAIVATGSYVDEYLFSHHFDLQESALHFLEESRLVVKTEKGWIPHHLLYELAEAEQLSINTRVALEYWYEQLDQLPQHIQACVSLILAVKSFGYEKKCDQYLKKAFQTLRKNSGSELNALIEGAEIFLTLNKITEAASLLIEILLEYGLFDLSAKLLSLSPDVKKFTTQIQLSKIHLLWRTGHWEESINSCNNLIKSIKSNSQLMSCYFHRGLCYFLTGNWKKAKSDFILVHESSTNIQYTARAQCMIGTIIGINGTDLKLGKEHLEKGAQILSQLNDLSGAWTGWNNLGELLWKCGEYRSSGYYLEKALKIASNPTTKIETLRNMLHLYLRVHGPFSKQVTNSLTEIKSLEWDSCDLFEIAQLLNTLTTAYIFQRDVDTAFSFLKLLVPLTSNNNENHIYTLSNLSLLARVLGSTEKSTKYFKKAIDLATQCDNLLAIHQLKNDHKLCFREP